jgi:hypothetical protein
VTSSELALAERLRGEMADLDHSVARVSAAWARARRATADQDYYLDAVALNLHGFYSGVERVFELTARYIDRGWSSVYPFCGLGCAPNWPPLRFFWSESQRTKTDRQQLAAPGCRPAFQQPALTGPQAVVKGSNVQTLWYNDAG